MSYNNPLYDELYHYGVLGMRWGVRRNPSRAYARASNKADKLRKKQTSLTVKSAKLQKKALEKEVKATNEKQYQKARKKQFKANKLNLKAAKTQKKYDKFVKRMESEFANVKVSSIPKETRDAGKRYVYMLAK
jgi:hypothetical protein